MMASMLMTSGDGDVDASADVAAVSDIIAAVVCGCQRHSRRRGCSQQVAAT